MIGIGKKRRQLAHRKRTAGGDVQRADQRHQRIDEIVDKASGRVGQRRIERGVERGLFQPFVDLVELLHVFRFVGKGLHGLKPRDRLLGEGGLFPPRLRLFLKECVGVRRNILRHEEGKRGDEHDDQRDFPICRQHKRKRAENGQNPRKELRKSHQKSVGELIGVRDNAADRLPVGMGIEVLERQDGNFRKGVRADIPQDVIGDAIVERAHAPLCDGGNPHRSADFEKYKLERGKIHFSRLYDTIHGVADENGNVERKAHRHDCQKQGCRKGKGVFPDVAEHLFHGALAHLRLSRRNARGARRGNIFALHASALLSPPSFLCWDS